MGIDPTPSALLAKEIGDKAERKLLAQRDGAPGVWFGLGTMGLIGWSVVVPTLLGAALGIWLDAHHPGTHPWSLALLMAGLVPVILFLVWGMIRHIRKSMH